LKPSEFWALTRTEFVAMRDGYLERYRRQVNESRHQAWHMTHWLLHRNPPELSNYLIPEKDEAKKKEEPRAQTSEELLARVKLLNAMLGGSEVKA